MFVANCPVHGRMLIWTSQIDGIENREDGIDVRFHFACGLNATLHTGHGPHADAT